MLSISLIHVKIYGFSLFEELLNKDKQNQNLNLRPQFTAHSRNEQANSAPHNQTATPYRSALT
jgi:hypothetical protein